MKAATVPRDSETHGGEDVGVYASGPWSHLFVGSYEQNVIPLVIAMAAEIGPFQDPDFTCAGVTNFASMIVVVIGLVIFKLF